MLRTPSATAVAAARGPAAARGRGFPRVHVAGQRLLAAQLDLSFAVDADDLDEDHVALVDHVLDALDPMRLELRDVDQAVFAGRDLDEGAERHHATDRTRVDAPDLRIFGDAPDDLPGAVAVGAAEGRDADLARILDVDLRTRLGADLLDHLAAGSDDLANLVGVDHHDVDPRRVGRELRTRLADRRLHLLQHVHPRHPRLLQRARHDVHREPFDLDVHLERGDAVARS